MEFSTDWPKDSKHYVNIWERREFENPTLSYYGVEGWKPMSMEEETKYWDELAAMGDGIVF